MKTMNFFQIKRRENLKGFNCDLTLEVNFDGKTYYGDLGGYDHHTKETETHPSPCNDKRIHFMDKSRIHKINKVLVIEPDLDVLFAAAALVYNEEFHDKGIFERTIWTSIEVVDKKGIRTIEEGEIPEQDVYIMESIWSAKKKGLLPSFYQKDEQRIMDITAPMMKHMEFIFEILTEETNHHQMIFEWKEELKEKINKCLIAENGLIRVFDTPSVPVNSAYYSEKYKKNADLILSYNSSSKKIRISSCNDKYDCKKLVQDFWGIGAGGHKGIGVSPRNKELSHLDLYLFYEYLKKELTVI